MEANTLDRIQFAFTITYHYLFPMLTMGLAPIIVIFKTLAIRQKDEKWNEIARFWGKIFGITFRPASVPKWHADVEPMGGSVSRSNTAVPGSSLAPLNTPDPQTFYAPGARGYTDYPALEQVA